MKFNTKLLLLLSLLLPLINACDKPDNCNASIPVSATNLKGELISATKVNLSWVDNSTNEEGFKIERKTTNSTWAIVGTAPANASSYSDENLTPITSYTYRIYPFNCAGPTPTYSNEATILTEDVPKVITGGMAAITSISANSGVQITSNGGSSISEIKICWSTSPFGTAGASIDCIQVTWPPVIGQSYAATLKWLKPNTTYYVRAQASNSRGTGYGNQVTFTTSSIDLTTGLIGYWPFNNNLNDASGNSRNGIIVPIIQAGQAFYTNDRFGNPNSAFNFTGSSYIKIPAAPTFSFGNSFSLACSVFPNYTSMGFADANLIRHGTTGWNNTNFQISTFSTDPINQILNTWRTFFCGTSKAWSGSKKVNGWFVCQYNSTNNRLYFITANQGEYSSIDSITVNPCASELSNDLFFGDNAFRGKMDEIRVYNKILTREQIQYLSIYH